MQSIILLCYTWTLWPEKHDFVLMQLSNLCKSCLNIAPVNTLFCFCGKLSLSQVNVYFMSALANLRAAIVALANSNSGASGTSSPGTVVLVSNLNEKVILQTHASN